MRPSDKNRNDSELCDKERLSHGARHGNTESKTLLRSSRYRKSQTAIGWDEDFCARDDAIAAEDHSYLYRDTGRAEQK